MKCLNYNSKEVPEQARFCPSCVASIQSTSKYRSVKSLITKHAELRGKRSDAQRRLVYEPVEEWQRTYDLAQNDPGFSAEYILKIGQRITWLKQQIGKGT